MSDTTDDGSTRRIENRTLPDDVGTNLQALFDTSDRPETFGEYLAAIAATFGDEWPPDIADLCHDDEGRHRGEAGAQSYRFTCVLDAVLLPFLLDEPVEIDSVDPRDGARVSARVTREGIETTPDDAAMSFGVAAVRTDADPTPARVYRSMCPYIHAFPDRDAYERWAAETDGATTGVALADGLELARTIART